MTLGFGPHTDSMVLFPTESCNLRLEPRRSVLLPRELSLACIKPAQWEKAGYTAGKQPESTAPQGSPVLLTLVVPHKALRSSSGRPGFPTILCRGQRFLYSFIHLLGLGFFGGKGCLSFFCSFVFFPSGSCGLAQQIRCLVCKHGDLSSNPQNP